MSDVKDTWRYLDNSRYVGDSCKSTRPYIDTTGRMPGRSDLFSPKRARKSVTEFPNLFINNLDILWNLNNWDVFPANESCSALETYPWIVRTHPSPLPHQLLSLPRPQPDCRAPNKGLQKHRKRGKPKVREGVQKPQRNNRKQLEHHLRHQCPTGSVKRDSGRFPLLLLPFDFNTSLTSCRKFKAFALQSVTKNNEPEYCLYVSGERMATIAMATPLSAKHKLIFTTTHRAI